MKKITFAAAALFMFSSVASTAATAETFTYSGGCFWCTEADTENLDGVSEVISGFTGGTTANPRYEPGNGVITARLHKLSTTPKSFRMKN